MVTPAPVLILPPASRVGMVAGALDIEALPAVRVLSIAQLHQGMPWTSPIGPLPFQDDHMLGAGQRGNRIEDPVALGARPGRPIPLLGL